MDEKDVYSIGKCEYCQRTLPLKNGNCKGCQDKASLAFLKGTPLEEIFKGFKGN